MTEPPRPPTAADFDEGYTAIADGSLIELFGQSREIEPFDFVPADGLAEVAALLRPAAGGRLLDLGCGRGGPGLWLAHQAGLSLVGVDFSPVAVAAAQQRRAQHFPDVDAQFVVGDATMTGLPDDLVDAVVSIDVLQLLPDRPGAVAEIVRVAKPGALVVVTTWGFEDAPAGRTPFDPEAVLRDAGIDVVADERPAWLDYQNAAYDRAVEVVARDGDAAPAAVRNLAEEARRIRPVDVRRLLLHGRTPP